MKAMIYIKVGILYSSYKLMRYFSLIPFKLQCSVHKLVQLCWQNDWNVGYIGVYHFTWYISYDDWL